MPKPSTDKLRSFSPEDLERHEPPEPPKKKRWVMPAIILVVVLAIGSAIFYGLHHKGKPVVTATNDSAATTAAKLNTDSVPASASKKSPAATTTNNCAGNTLSHEVIVSVSQQHMWACGGSSQLYDSAVVTGMEQYPADLTPTGTYRIYAKQTGQDLKGCDGTGCWDDQVSYWMPFLYNAYGIYGFHDASWRSSNEFGNVNINAPYTTDPHGSHGCVELPTATAKWLYDWAPIGTTVKIES